MTHNDDQTFDPMIYDAMRELETRIGGTYIAWAREAATPAEAAHWKNEMYKLSDEVRAVDSRSRSAINAKREQLSVLLASLPVHAPALSA
ncbi:hypothetical protein ACI3KS_12305 [Microbacterium sp. ZW T5_45]|uniref:hypothetical protein n=1 Tax=Microbacterium sp. ZW T5_45 TaxID=3378080 RepID=UPI0038552A0D